MAPFETMPLSDCAANQHLVSTCVSMRTACTDYRKGRAIWCPSWPRSWSLAWSQPQAADDLQSSVSSFTHTDRGPDQAQAWSQGLTTQRLSQPRLLRMLRLKTCLGPMLMRHAAFKHARNCSRLPREAFRHSRTTAQQILTVPTGPGGQGRRPTACLRAPAQPSREQEPKQPQR